MAYYPYMLIMVFIFYCLDSVVDVRPKIVSTILNQIVTFFRIQMSKGILSRDMACFKIYTHFFLLQKGYINFVSKSSYICLSIHLSVCSYATFLVIVSSHKPLAIAISNNAGA